MFGVTDGCRLVLGTKKGAWPHDWEDVTHRFFDVLHDWWQTHPVRLKVPPPPGDAEHPRTPGVGGGFAAPEGSSPRLYTLPCCDASPCRRRSCEAVITTGAPWLNLHQLAAHTHRMLK